MWYVGGGWHIEANVDDDGHLNLFVINEDGSDIIELENLSGDGHQEPYSLRFTTESIEDEYATTHFVPEG